MQMLYFNKNQMFRRLLCVVTLLLCLARTKAQQTYRFDTYGVADGLPQSSVWSMLQDRKGFLWIGTADGICRYDGIEFKSVRHPHDTLGMLAIKGLVHFFEDRNGDIWIVHKTALDRYVLRAGKLERIAVLPTKNEFDVFNRIMGQDNEGYIWLGIPGHGLVRVHPATGKLSAPVDISKSGTREQISVIGGFVGTDGNIWGSNLAGRNFCYNIRTGNIRWLPGGQKNYAMVSLNDSIVLTGNSSMLYFLNRRTGHADSVSITTRNRVPGSPENIMDMVADKEGNIWLCTSHGAYVYNLKQRSITREHFTSGNGQRNYTYVFTAYCDRTGNMWLGMNGDGLRKYVRPTKRFLHYVAPGPRISLVKSVLMQDSLILVGLYDDGVDVFHERRGFLKKLNSTTLPGFPQSCSVYAMSSFGNGKVIFYYTGVQRGLGILDLSSFRFRRLDKALHRDLPGLPMQNITAPFFVKISEGEHLFGWHQLLLRMTIDANGEEHFSRVAVPGNKELLTAGLVLKDSTLIIGSAHRLFLKKGEDWTSDEIPGGNALKTLGEDASGNIWAGTVNGIYVYDRNLRQLKRYDESNGLPNTFIYGILRDSAGDLWISHNKGLSRYLHRKKSFVHYGPEDGLQSNEFNTGSYAYAPGGRLLFGGINGVNLFAPSEIGVNPVRPGIAITSVLLFDQPLQPEGDPDQIKELKLDWRQNSLSFEFAALEFSNASRNQYAYKMEGVDRDWIHAGNRRFARYPGLPPGNYVFLVKASNNDGVWQETPRKITIAISPPFWKQTWFLVLVGLCSALAIGAFVYLFDRWRLRKKLRQIELQQRLQQERERISRDLHDNVGTQLSLISNNLEWVISPAGNLPPAEQRNKLSCISQSAREIITTLRDTIWALNREAISLEELSDKLKAFVSRQLSTYDQIELQYRESIEDSFLLGPSEALNLFRICQEAVANAVKYAGCSALKIEIMTSGAGYNIEIHDNGTGFDQETYKAGYGLENMRHRAQESGMELDIRTGIGNGTSICLKKKILQMS